MEKREYDLALKSKALTTLALRIVVAAYMVYLAWKILSGALNDGSPIPEWGAWLIFLVFAAAAVGFCVYAWMQYKRLLKAAEITNVSQSLTNDFDTTAESQIENDVDDSED